MSAPGLSRVRAIAGLASLALHALGFGALFLFAPPQAVGFNAPATPIMAFVEIQPAPPQQPTPAPRRERRVTTAMSAATEIAAPAAIASDLIPAAAAAPATTLSREEEDAYVRAVWMRLAAHRPRASGGRRIARIAFALDGEGGLRYARLERSSGSTAFDQACLRAVRAAAPFPRPPAGAADDLLAFVVPISTGP